MQNFLPPLYLYVGSIVTLRIRETLGLAIHFGVVTDRIGLDGLPMVIANSPSRGGPALMTWSEFSQGQPIMDVYYPSSLPSPVVLQRAYSMFGTRYDLLNWNCEHFANVCHGRPAISLQVRTVAAVAAVTGIALLLAKAA